MGGGIMFNLDKSNDNKYFLVFLSIKRMLCGHPLPLESPNLSVVRFTGETWFISCLVWFGLLWDIRESILRMARDLRTQNRREQNLNELSFISFPCIIFSGQFFQEKKWKGKEKIKLGCWSGLNKIHNFPIIERWALSLVSPHQPLFFFFNLRRRNRGIPILHKNLEGLSCL